MLVHFPVVFWTVAVGAYVAAAFGVEKAAEVAKLSNGVGLIMAGLAMIAGLVELRAIDDASEAMRVATRHMMVMATAWLCFMLALVLTAAAGIDPATAQVAGALFAAAGFLLMGTGGWLGGRLVYEFGVGGGVRSHAKRR